MNGVLTLKMYLCTFLSVGVCGEVVAERVDRGVEDDVAEPARCGVDQSVTAKVLSVNNMVRRVTMIMQLTR
ncbi:hypothetical protein BU25DRAFT_69486 [Macroventuria anomochaeta]|uniref:Uncharacterized protein n=1 Tax=Macroventuria anomochaeta TaxID=301207 RepID=A0ACB6RYN6_9PLEO|nr:uncharacterized protein BU25DRAFT_69486 [Macroventuria anomochaeta]KAF2627090.1 hypothetical protein BU25DRAFT_69486 [Macroventuria anomochaeta]